jgi:DNA repair exonuclease SbcCD ATPase subunit
VSALLLKVAEGRGFSRALAQMRPDALDALGQLQQELKAVQKRLAEVLRSLTKTTLDRCELTKALWSAYCDAVIQGDTKEVQELRAEFASQVDDALKGVEETLASLREAREDLAFGSDEETQLLQARAETEALRQRVLNRWQTVEDLEDVVAEWTAATTEQVDAVARKYGPPTAWFEQGEPLPK